MADPKKSKRWKIVLLAALVPPLLLLGLLLFGEKWLVCLAYYEQCTADRIPALTEAQCFARGDAVAYLLEKNICLVKRK